ncbi:PD40 domain-containing protein, partial [Candidatus Bipolaricaulota bacterium]|nr:PD40 domain-containing protein [Candidatus Bipolaricaulota bacterium]
GPRIRQKNRPPSGQLPMLDPRPLTALAGRERYAAFSPDGHRVAFAWNRDDTTGYDIHIKQSDADAILQITQGPEDDIYPVWSPDGSRIAFLRSGEKGGIYIVPSLGGLPQLVLGSANPTAGLDWSPDGRFLACIIGSGSPTSIHLYSLEDGQTKQLTNPPPASRGDMSPEFSRDGTTLGFVRLSGAMHQSLHTIPVSGGTERRLPLEDNGVLGLSWTRDDAGVLYVGVLAERCRLWHHDFRSKITRWLPTPGQTIMRPCLDPTGTLLIYEKVDYDIDIWRLALREDDSAVGSPELLLNSTSPESNVVPNPLCTMIAFISRRSGNPAIWLSQSDGSNPQRLTTSADGALAEEAALCWSPDGQQLAASFHTGNRYAIHVVDISERTLQPLTESPENEFPAFWSRDDWIYYRAVSEQQSTWKRMAKDGSLGEHLDLPESWTLRPGPGDDVIYLDIFDGSFLSWSPHTNRTRRIVDRALDSDWQRFDTTPEGIYFTAGTRLARCLRFHDFSTGQSREVCELPAGVAGDIHVCADGSALFVEIPEVRCDLQIANIVLAGTDSQPRR